MRLVLALFLVLVAILVATFIAINRAEGSDAVGHAVGPTPGSVHASG